MITRPTVFVLGAGASAPYGFPLGNALKGRIAKELSQENSKFEVAVRMSAAAELSSVRSFAEALRRTHFDALDEFVQWKPQFRKLAKHAIACALMAWETDQFLRPDSRTEKHWYPLLFSNLVKSSLHGKCAIGDNRLTIVTFNFDRSFQRALFVFATDDCGGTAEDVLRIPFHPIHGQLSAPDWLPCAAGAHTRSYTAGDDLYESGYWHVIRECAESIRIVDEEVVNSEALLAATQALQRAERVCFLGFSYHPMNLNKLGIENLKKDAEVYGTTFELPAGQRDSVAARFGKAGIGITLRPPTEDVVAFLQNTNVIYE